ncbi:NAD-dependent epimerase/dehydratase family protein [Desulfonatronum parangueonense]
MNRILVTGATGFIGLELARQLAAQNMVPRLLVRRPSRAGLLKGLDVKIIPGDLEDVQSLHRAVQGVDTVIHLGGRALFERYELVRPTLVGGSTALMREAVAAGVRSFVYASSLLVYKSQEGFIDADTPPTPILGYGRAKFEAEQELTRMAREAGMRLAIIRLPHIYGATSLMFDHIRRGWVVQPGPGENVFSHMHVHDAARILRAAALSDWSGATPVGDNQPMSWVAFMTQAKGLYPHFRHLRVPVWLAMAGCTVLETGYRLLRRPALLTTDAVRGFNLRVAVRPNLLFPELGLELRYPTVLDGLAEIFCENIPFTWLPSVRDRCACYLDKGACPLPDA